MITADDAPPFVGQILQHRKMRGFIFPDLAFFLEPCQVHHYEYSKTYEQARLEPLVALHTSGSTGLPKPVVMNHGTLSPIDTFWMIPSLGGREVVGPSLSGTRLFLAFPLFHAASMCYLLGLGIYCGVTCVLPSPKVPLTAILADQIHIHGNVQGSALPPSIVVDIVNHTEYCQNIKSLDYLIYAGGPLPRETGDAVSKWTKVLQLSGSTEIGLPATELCEDEDWEYFSYSPFMGFEFRQVEGSEYYEQFIVRRRELSLYQSVFMTFPNINEYSLKDLYVKHPFKEGLWRLCGRTDDIIVFSNGEKINPTTMEGMISSHPAVSGALVSGHGKFQAALLVETKKLLEGDRAKAEALEEIWPIIEKANQSCPAHGRIMKDFITFVLPERPMLRAGKGTIQRRMTLDFYHDELEKLYLGQKTTEQLPGDSNDDEEPLERYIMRAIEDITSSPYIAKMPNFFDGGLDSLQVLSFVRRLNSSLRGRPRFSGQLAPELIYSNPNITALSAAIEQRHLGCPQVLEKPDHVQTMHQLYSKMSSDRASRNPHVSRIPTQLKSPQPKVVLLTGSTGSLGTYILHKLIQTPEVIRVHCLNRYPSALPRQLASLRSQNLAFDPDKTHLISCNLAGSQFDLSDDLYSLLSENVTHIIHNAWEVNFNLPLSSFESHLRAVNNICDFAVRSSHKAPIIFVSSISSVANPRSQFLAQRGHENLSVPQEAITDLSAPLEMGYAESKLIAENLFVTSGIPNIVARVGHIAGPSMPSGRWNQDDWISSVITSSVYLGKIPSTLGNQDSITWIPVDKVADILLEITLAEDREKKVRGEIPKTEVLNVLNPRRSSWSAILPFIVKNWNTALQIVSLEAWLNVLRESSLDSEEDQLKNPALRLLGFLETLMKDEQQVQFATTKAEARSPTLANIEAIGEKDFRKWMNGWGYLSVDNHTDN